MRWNHLFKEAVGLGFLGMLLPCAGVSAAEEGSSKKSSTTIHIQTVDSEKQADGETMRFVAADEEKQGNQVRGTFQFATSDSADSAHSKFWIGVGCQPASPALRAQLDLPQGQGLMVAQLAPDGPAGKAGIKEFDVLLTAGDTPLAQPGDLVKAVDAAQDKEITLKVIRGGKSMTITVKPAERPKEGRGTLQLAGGPDQEAWQKWLEQMPKMPGGGAGGGSFGGPPGSMQFRVFNPGMVMPWGGGGTGRLTLSSRVELPDNTTVTITRQGKEPAKINVKQGDENWEVTEDGLDQLPQKVRDLVRPMVGGMPGQMMFSAKAVPVPGGAGGGGGAMGGSGHFEQRVGPPRENVEERLEGKLEELGRGMTELRDAIRDLRESRARREAPPPKPGGNQE